MTAVAPAGSSGADAVIHIASLDPAREIVNALVIGAHARDDAPGYPDDIELSFELSADEAVTVMLSDFLATWIPRLPESVPAIVLVADKPFRVLCKQLGAGLAFALACGERLAELVVGA